MKNHFIILLLLTFLFVGCNKDDPEANIQADYEVAVGETFQIKLAANQTTGYTWAWINKSAVSIVDTIEMNYIAGTGIGASGQEVWEFKGISEGLDTLVFDYRQVWDASTASDTATYIVRVK